MTIKHLPLATQFCGVAIELWDGLEFFVDGNSKITRENGTYAEPRPNAFSLPAASVPNPYAHVSPRACPGSTPICRSSCYVKGLAQHAPELYARYQGNAEALASVMMYEDTFIRSAHILAQWIEGNAPHGFRWHVSGDVLGEVHARWIRMVCAMADNVPFWIYTRTLDAVPILASGAKNLAVNVSADADNYEDARTVALETGARVCYLVDESGHVPEDMPAGSVLFPDYALRGRSLAVPTDAPWWQTLSADQRKQVCPTDFFGQSESARCGPCTKCF